MGGCQSGEDDQTKHSKMIDRDLKGSRKELSKEVKLLLLGAGESGKSTFVKQMKIIHLDGFSDTELRRFQSIIWDNVLSCCVSLIRGAEKLGIAIQDESAANDVLRMEDDPDQILEIADAIKRVWADPGIQEAFAQRAEFQLLDSCHFYLERADVILDEEYTPSEDDVLHSRSRTTGIKEISFKLQDFHFRLVDVGGQRSERKKWIHCFEDVTAVIFCVALSAYDQILDEDGKTNRMTESLRLFKVVCSEYFADIPVILFLNKKDLFQDKILKTNITTAFRDYRGAQEYEPAMEYIKKQFLAQAPSKEIFARAICALNTDSIRLVFDSVRAIMLKGMFEDSF